MSRKHEVPAMDYTEEWVPNDDGDETPAQVFYNMPLPSGVGGERWSTCVEGGERLKLQCVGENAYWSIHLTCIAGEQRFEVEANAWEVDVTEVLPMIADIVCEQVEDTNRPVRLKLQVTY